MPWQVKVNPDIPVIETYYIGDLNPDDLNAAVKDTLDLALTHEIRLFLGDCTALAGGHSVFDLYDLARRVSTTCGGKLIKEAIILPEIPAQKESAMFWETTCVNRGLQVRIFADRKSALDWLTAKDRP